MERLRRAADHAALLLLSLLLIGATAAAPTAEQAARDARSALDRSSFDEAQRIIDDALQRFGTRNDETIWLLRVMHAEVLHGRGKWKEERAALQRELPPALRTGEAAVRRLLSLGNAAVNLGETKEGARRYEQARAIAAAHQPQMLGDVYAAMTIAAPSPKKAEEYAGQAIAFARKAGKPRPEIQALAALQYQYARAGRYSDAIQAGEKGLAAAKAARHEKRIQQIAGNLGWSYMELGDYDSAAEFFTVAEATAARIGAAGDRVPWLTQLGNLRGQKHDWRGAERLFLAALPNAEGSNLGYLLANLAAISLETGKLDDARRYNARALEAKRKAGNKEAELKSLIIDARIAAAANDFTSATAILNRVIREKASKATQWEARGRLAEVFVKAKRFDDADREFRRAIDTVREARQAIDDKELRFSFFNLTTDIFSAYIDFLVDRQQLAGALAATEEIRIGALDEKLDKQTNLRAVDARIVAAQRGATILSYWLGPKQSYVWKITPAEIRVARLAPAATIDEAVERYRREIDRRSASQTRGQQLYRLLGRPRGSRVVIIPDGSLHGLNFETLVVPSPRPHHWIEDALISEASSIRMLARPRRAPGAAPTMLLIGNPPPSDPAFPPLPRAGEEMRSVAAHFPSAKVLEGPAATPAAYHGATPRNFDYVHFVAHGIATRKRPLESAVILAGDKLLARDIIQQPLDARLVTISSCYGAGTRAYTSEGLVGLAWAFLRAGASSVIAALWEVNDSATPQLMNRFYEKTAAGADPAAALREAKLSLLHSNSIYRYPRYWAPFVYYE